MKIQCDICQCTDSEENPVLEIINEDEVVEQYICLDCFAKVT